MQLAENNIHTKVLKEVINQKTFNILEENKDFIINLAKLENLLLAK